MAYPGSVDLISGIRPKNNGSFPLVNAHDVYVDDEHRLDDVLGQQGGGSDGKARAALEDIADYIDDYEGSGSNGKWTLADCSAVLKGISEKIAAALACAAVCIGIVGCASNPPLKAAGPNGYTHLEDIDPEAEVLTYPEVTNLVERMVADRLRLGGYAKMAGDFENGVLRITAEGQGLEDDDLIMQFFSTNGCAAIAAGTAREIANFGIVEVYGKQSVDAATNLLWRAVTNKVDSADVGAEVQSYLSSPAYIDSADTKAGIGNGYYIKWNPEQGSFEVYRRQDD